MLKALGRLILFLAAGLLFPWWALAFAAFATGWWEAGRESGGHWQAGLTGAFSGILLALYRDQRSDFIIGRRLSGLFHLPSFYFIYILMALLGFVTVFLWHRVGQGFARRNWHWR